MATAKQKAAAKLNLIKARAARRRGSKHTKLFMTSQGYSSGSRPGKVVRSTKARKARFQALLRSAS